MLSRIVFSNKSMVIVHSYSMSKDVKKIVGGVQHGSAIVLAYYRFREGWLSPVVDETVFQEVKYDYDITMALYTSQHYERAASRQAFEQSTEEILYNAFRAEQAGDTYAHLPAITTQLMGREWVPPTDEDVKRRRRIIETKEKKSVQVIEDPGTVYYVAEEAKKSVEAGKKGRIMTYHADRKCGQLNKGGATIVAIAENYDRDGLLGKMKQCKRCSAKATVIPVEDPTKAIEEQIAAMPDSDDKNQSVLIVEQMKGLENNIISLRDRNIRLEEHATHQENEIDVLTHKLEDVTAELGSTINELDVERCKMKADELIRLFEKDLISKAKNEKNVRNDEVGMMYRTLLFLKEKAK